ncbi:MAG TPA: hypothetical protein VIV58_14370 [Kofleriaceae bacterium]
MKTDGVLPVFGAGEAEPFSMIEGRLRGAVAFEGKGRRVNGKVSLADVLRRGLA